MSQHHIGYYQVEDVLRVGPLGRLVRARLPESPRALLAVELCPPPTLAAGQCERLVEAFEKEREALTALQDPRVLTPAQCGRSLEGMPYVAFEDPRALGYAPLPEDPRALPAGEWLRIAIEVLGALESLSAAGITCYRFPAGAVFVGRSGALVLLSADLEHLAVGLALPRAFVSPDPALAAPEVLAGQAVTPAALTFSAAAWLYNRLSGGAPAVLGAMVLAGTRPPPLWSVNAAVSSTVDDVLQRAVSRDPAKRFPSAGALGAALEQAAPGGDRRPVELRPVGRTVEEPLPPVVELGAWAVGLALAGCAAGWALAQIAPLDR